MEKEAMTKSLKLEIEDLEERIAPGIATLTIIEAGIDVVGPAEATFGAGTAFGNVSANTEIANLDVAIEC